MIETKWRSYQKIWASHFLRDVGPLFIFACLLQPAAAQNSAVQQGKSAAKRALTIADSIQMRRIIDLEKPAYLGIEGPVEHFDLSQDGRHFFVVTRKGNTKSGLNEYELLLYKTAEVLEFVNNANALQLPSGRTLAQFSTSSEYGLQRQHAIHAARWLPDNQTILFIGDTGADPGQIYSIDIETKEFRQRTFHSRAIVAFDVDSQSRSLLFLSTLPNLHEDRNKTSLVVGTEWISNLANMNRERLSSSLQFQFYYLPPGYVSDARPVGKPYFGGIKNGQDFWLSPDGLKAIVVLPYNDRVPDGVLNYLPIAESNYISETVKNFDKDFMKLNNSHFAQFQLLDLQTGELDQILKGAPIGKNISRYGAMWLPDGEKVVLANTFLPKGDSSASEWQRRRESPAIAEYDVRTAEITRIEDLAVPIVQGASFQSAPTTFNRLSMNADGLLTISFQKSIAIGMQMEALEENELTKSYENINGRWVSLAGLRIEHETVVPRLLLSIREDMSTAPEVFAIDTKTGTGRIITDLNPQFRDLTFGKVERLHWTDVESRGWQGRLFYPPKFERDRKYPLVIQTRGLRENQFTMDGTLPVGSFAAQALANSDMLVLQVIRIGQVKNIDMAIAGTPAELVAHRQGIESAIDKLDRMELIDRHKVGILGYSRSGYYVDDTILFSDYEFAAAIVTDASSLGLGYLSQLYGLGAPGMRRVEKIHGDFMPWGDSLLELASRTTTFNLDRIKTPIRMEYYLHNVNYAGHWWEQYVLLRRMHKPVELVLFPKANHIPISPRVRVDSMGGSVDWFAFWLKGEEDPDPRKAEQYQRWRTMRDQQAKSEIAANRARQWRKEKASRRKAADAWLDTKEGKAAAEAAALELASDLDDSMD